MESRHFSLFLSQSRRPRIWRPAVPCPQCAYLNDDSFNFCQRCGFRRDLVVVDNARDLVKIDLKDIEDRISELKEIRSNKPYEKQKSSTHRELVRFLASLPTPKSLSSASPGDIQKFLVWKDKSGRTKVHQMSCPQAGQTRPSSCSCPTRLAAGTVDSLLGKLRAIFAEAGLGGEWDDRLGIGNPVSHPSIKNYLKLIKEEQAKARVCPKKAVPLFLKKLQIIAQFILAQLQSPRISPISLYIFSRDLCFFTTDFFSGDRSSDLGRVLSREVLYFPDSSGILFNHTFGKTLRGHSVNTFAVRRCDNLVVCPVKNFERYIAVAKLIKINLGQGFLFRVTKGNNVTREPFIGSAVHGRLKFYLDQIQANDGETPHSSRSGCSITLSLLGASKEAVANHVGWASTKMVDHYNDLRSILHPNAPAALLSAEASGSSCNVAMAYESFADISSFKPVFP